MKSSAAEDTTSYGSVVAATVLIDDFGPTVDSLANNGTGGTSNDPERQPLTSSAVTPASSATTSTGPQGPQCQDGIFAILFWMHIIVMLYLGIAVAPKGYGSIDLDLSTIELEVKKNSDDLTDEDMAKFDQFVTVVTEYAAVYPMRIFLYLVLPCCCFAVAIALIITVFIVKPFPKTVVYTSLVGSLILMLIFMVASLLASSGSFLALLFTGVSMAAVVYYVSMAWRMVPFAAVNLKVALEGMSRNCGIYIVGLVFAELGFLWVVFWGYTWLGFGAYDDAQCRAAHPDANFDVSSDDYSNACGPQFGIFALFLLSLYWTSTVIMNTVQVTVAGVQATWCFAHDEADSCCSSAIFASLYRSLTFSFGSICFGSLLQALVSMFRFLVESARKNRDQEDTTCGSIFLCLLECLARLLEDIMEYFNQWAYVFVGIYGYSYLESGKRVMELFRARGWTAIITDNLVGYVLGVTVFATGLLTGIVALLEEKWISTHWHDVNHPDVSSYLGLNLTAAFIIGMIIGVWVCSVMMSVIKGAVNTLIVCWADSPAVMELEHPDLTKEMADAWTQVFPEAAVYIRPVHAVVV